MLGELKKELEIISGSLNLSVLWEITWVTIHEIVIF